ncbi:MAG: DegV family EDD domain-containing protein [Dehalococcoidales bacterium]|nr:DegV family EDD domain-containing protein [Dehalococcoidales bacterium]
MSKVAVITDSSASIPLELKKQYGIETIPLLLHMDDKTYKDRIDIKTPDELFQLMKKLSRFPTTSAPPPGEYAKVYRRLSQKVDSIFTITVSSELSASFKSALQAKEIVKDELPDTNIQVFDSRTTASGMGLTALAVARAAASGQDMEAVVKIAEDIRSKVNNFGIFDSLS